MNKIPPGLFQIWWYSGGIVKQEIFHNAPVPYPVALSKKKILRATTHRTGELRIVPDYMRVTSLIPDPR